MTESPLMDSGLVVLVFSPGDDPIACLNKAMAFLTVVASSRVMLLVLGKTMQVDSKGNCQAGQILDEEQFAFLADPGVLDGQAVQTITPNNAAFQTEDLDTYDSGCDDISNAKAVLTLSQRWWCRLWGDDDGDGVEEGGGMEVEFFEGWKPLSPLQLAMEEVMSEYLE
ncbi:hypothetical protein Tco_0751447 [Tanacetum coccineum]|uniref:Uncharacterized protein n=1 Tax=Tanacetum coccineum TaxID=301880 RepID=A0ABQ4Z583_9ASTR